MGKNENEYREGDRLFVKEIKSCSCSKEEGGVYTLRCRIHQRGEKEYLFEEGCGYLRRGISEKKLWLGEEAKKTAGDAVKAFMAEALHIFRSDAYTRASSEDGELVLFYRRLGEDLFDALFERKGESPSLRIYRGLSLEKMLKEFGAGDGLPIEEHPIYISAAGDGILRLQIKVLLSAASGEECEALGRMLGKRILPPLPGEYDKNFVVSKEGMSEEDFDMLFRSGYRILHRPYFAMAGSSRSKMQLNPHTKGGVDAVGRDEEAMSFGEYLEMVENNR